MLPVQTAEQVYAATDELVVELKAIGESQMAAILHHRLHKVAWTSRAELFEELRKVLSEKGGALPVPLREQVQRIIGVIEGVLGGPGG